MILQYLDQHSNLPASAGSGLVGRPARGPDRRPSDRLAGRVPASRRCQPVGGIRSPAKRMLAASCRGSWGAGLTARPAPLYLSVACRCEPARLLVDGSPSRPRAEEPVTEPGAPSAGSARNPNSRLGRREVSPDLQGRVMDQPPPEPVLRRHRCRQRSARCPSAALGRGLCRRPRRAGLERLVARLRQAAPALGRARGHRRLRDHRRRRVGGAELPLAVVNPRQIRDFARALGGSPRPTPWTPR